MSDGAAEYEKRLSVLCPVHNIGIAEERLGDNPSDNEILNVLAREGEAIKRQLPSRSYKIALCVEGKQISSQELAQLMERLPHEGYSELSFVIGSSHGIDESVKAACNMRLSFSRMTFPHQLMRVILLEQLYRAASINAGSRYHK